MAKRQSSNITISNTFDGGLVTVMNPMTSPENTVNDALNMELITTGDDQYLFQNIKGNTNIINGKKVELPSYTHTDNIEYPFIPLGVKVFNNIAYILAGAFKGDEFLAGTIGSFPSPDWDELNNGSGSSPLKYEFSPFHNFKKDLLGPDVYTDPFISKEFNFYKNRYIDIVVQGDYDRSVNVIFTDGINKTKVINSRFKSSLNRNIYSLANRFGNKDTNTYSDKDWDRISLIQVADTPIVVDSFNVKKGGYLKGGGYQYFFKYVTQEGNATDILYESPLIPIANGKEGLFKTDTSDKYVEFHLSGLDESYKGIQVYFALYDGYPKATTETYKIDYIFGYDDSTLVIKHTGLEKLIPIKVGEINSSFSPVDTVQSIDIINDRIALAGITATLLEEDIDVLREAAKKITIKEVQETIDKGYYDPNIAAKKLGFWKGEVYELGVVWSLKNKGLSPVFPITGMDNIDGAQQDPNINWQYPTTDVTDPTGFDINNRLHNHKGVFRTSNTGTIYTPKEEKFRVVEGYRNITFLRADVSQISTVPKLDDIVTGFFIVRRRRIKNVAMQGIINPTIKLPSTRPATAPENTTDDIDFIGNRRHIIPADTCTLNRVGIYPAGLNGPLTPYTLRSKDLYDSLPIVFAPLPTAVLPLLSHNKSHMELVKISNEVSCGTVFGNTTTINGAKTNEQHLSFFSTDLELNYEESATLVNGASPSIEIQEIHGTESPIALGPSLKFPTYAMGSPDHFILNRLEPLSIEYSTWKTFSSDDIETTLVDSGKEITATKSFTGKTDRTIGFRRGFVGTSGNPYIDQTIKEIKADGHYMPYDLLSSSYSVYLGIKIDTTDPVKFNFMAGITGNDHYDIGDIISSNFDMNSYFTGFYNMGHLANIFRSSRGRWTPNDIVDIYKADSNSPYHASTERFTIGSVQEVDIYRGDGFISRVFKRVSYKNGLKSGAATTADAGTFGTGIIDELGSKLTDDEKINQNLHDEGRNLFDQGITVEITSFSNVNGDLRSEEVLSEEDKKLNIGKRSFWEKATGAGTDDFRPDSKQYNHGYTGDNPIVSYFRIKENTATVTTEFPNRVMLSERNQVQDFYNSFRDLRGFNFRDYGIEYGPITKIININGMLLSIHPTGTLGIGVDDRTLVSEGADVYVNTATALSQKAITISSVYGSTHPESIVRTEETVAGVDYLSSIIWLFSGDKLNVISEFSINNLLDKFKEQIESGDFDGGDPAIHYTSKVYSTYDFNKHTLIVSYVAEHPETKDQIHIGTVTFNTVIGKWMSRLSEGNKFSAYVSSYQYTFGFSDLSGIWKEDSLIDPNTGEYIRSRFRGIDYRYEFEITLNEQPSLEKVLNNIRMITNKSIPLHVIYTTSGDINDAAENIWGNSAAAKIVTQPLVTRNKSPRNSIRLGILDENVYYKNSNLYIEVGRVGVSRKNIGNKNIRDKNIRVRLVYEGNDATFIQAIISILSISYT